MPVSEREGLADVAEKNACGEEETEWDVTFQPPEMMLCYQRPVLRVMAKMIPGSAEKGGRENP